MQLTGRVVLFAGEPERAVAGELFAEHGERLAAYGCAGLVNGCPNRAECVGEQPIVAITADACGVDVVIAVARRDQRRQTTVAVPQLIDAIDGDPDVLSVVAKRLGDTVTGRFNRPSKVVIHIAIACRRALQVAGIVVAVRGAGGGRDQLTGRIDGVPDRVTSRVRVRCPVTGRIIGKRLAEAARIRRCRDPVESGASRFVRHRDLQNGSTSSRVTSVNPFPIASINGSIRSRPAQNRGGPGSLNWLDICTL